MVVLTKRSSLLTLWKMSADDKYFYLSYHWFKELQDDDIIDMKGVKPKFSLSDVFTGKYAEAKWKL